MTRRARIVVGILIALIAVATAGVVVGARQLEPRLHRWVISTLSTSLQSEVELGSVRLNWVPLQLHASDLTVRHRGRTDVPPLIVVKTFSVDLRPTDLWSSMVDHIQVDGLEINIPPKDRATGERALPRPSAGGDDDGSGVVVRRLTATNSRLAIIPREAGKNAKVWDIFELDMKNLRSDEPATFTAALINPIPYGKIESNGSFGPWQSDEPGTSPIAGEYTFAADLGTINGLDGELNAVGTMTGTIEQIKTTGETRTEAFRLTELDGASLPVHSSYDAVVDGTRGGRRPEPSRSAPGPVGISREGRG